MYHTVQFTGNTEQEANDKMIKWFRANDATVLNINKLSLKYAFVIQVLWC